MRLTLFLTTCFISIFSAHAQGTLDFDCSKIENLTGHKGDMDLSTGIFKVSVPHKDVKVSTIGILLTPELGLNSWADFKKAGSEVEVTGEMVLLEDQINEVMKAAFDNGFRVKSLYNKYLWDTPKLMFIQIEGNGSLNDVAKGVGVVFETLQKTRKRTIWGAPLAHIDARKTTLDVRNIETVVGKQGTLKNGVYKVVFGKAPEGGVSKDELTWAAFAGTNKHAVILGDIAMHESEVQDVLKSLIKNNFLVLSLHQYRNSNTQVVHYIKQGPAVDLAKQLMETLGIKKDHPNITEVSVKELPASETIPLEENTDRIRKFNGKHSSPPTTKQEKGQSPT